MKNRGDGIWLAVVFSLAAVFFVKIVAFDSLSVPHSVTFRCIALLLALINADGFLYAYDMAAMSWGGEWDFTAREGNVFLIIVAMRIFELVFEALPQAIIQAFIILRGLRAQESVETLQWISLFTSVVVVIVALRGAITAVDLRGASYFDGAVLWFFAASDTFMRVATLAILFAVDQYFIIELGFLCLFGFCCVISRSREDSMILIMSSFMLSLPCLLSPCGMMFTIFAAGPDMVLAFRDTCFLLLLPRQVELLVSGCYGLLVLGSDPLYKSLSLAVVVVWPLTTLAMGLLLALYVLPNDEDLIIVGYVSAALKRSFLGFNATVIDGICIAICRLPCTSCRRRRRDFRIIVPACQIPPPPEDRSAQWLAKAEELGNRGFELGPLLDFFSHLGTSECMPSFDLARSTTNDVVREAIIPASWPFQDASTDGQALAPLLQGGPLLARRLVSHTWTNLFANTVAAMVADALDEPTYDSILPRLHGDRIQDLKRELHEKGMLSMSYWFCALSVNQHDNICGGFGPEPAQNTSEFRAFDMKRRNVVTQSIYPLCTCRTIKHFNDAKDLCEINKFDDMMNYMAMRN